MPRWGCQVIPLDRESFKREVSRAFIYHLTFIGPCTVAEARYRQGIHTPPGVDGRCIGGVATLLHNEGRIVATGVYRPSPFEGCHDTRTVVWRLAEVKP